MSISLVKSSTKTSGWEKRKIYEMLLSIWILHGALTDSSVTMEWSTSIVVFSKWMSTFLKYTSYLSTVSWLASLKGERWMWDDKTHGIHCNSYGEVVAQRQQRLF